MRGTIQEEWIFLGARLQGFGEAKFREVLDELHKLVEDLEAYEDRRRVRIRKSRITLSPATGKKDPE